MNGFDFYFDLFWMAWHWKPAIGKKLGEILPGLIGTIASFIFKAAGEVISFLDKNAWLLVVAVVVYAVEQFKSKNKK